MQGDDAVIRATGAGNHRFSLLRSPQSLAWNALTCVNPGGARLDGVKLWGLGGPDLVDLKPASGAAAQPFPMLAGEKLFISATHVAPKPGAPPQSLLSGVFVWQWPPATAAPFAADSRTTAGLSPANQWPGRIQGAGLGPDGSIVLQPDASGEGWIEVEMDSPVPLKSLRVAWDSPKGSAAAANLVDVWVGDQNGALIQAPRASFVDFERPVDVPAASGRRSLRLRLAYSQASGGGPPPSISRLRIEREIEVPGGIQLFPAGASEARAAFESPADGTLELHLLALPAL